MRTIGVDTGGTFTDLVAVDTTGAKPSTDVHKLPSTPHDPGRAVLAGLAALGIGPEDNVVHGTTVALNALLTGNTAATALVTNAGFRDMIEIGRQDRPDIYALHPEKVAPLAPRELRFEVGQRSAPDLGDPTLTRIVEEAQPSDAELDALAHEVEQSGARTVAVCLLHSYADSSPERRVADALRRRGLDVTCSGELLSEHREFERFTAALVNAALVPTMRDYLAGLASHLEGAKLSILQSSGGTLSAERASIEPVRVVLSGPAGGVVGASIAAGEAGFSELVALDMGGTSTDVAFADAPRAGGGHAVDAGAAARTSSRLPNVAGHALAAPTLDIHTIGCGGGSMLRVDTAGALRVGPESAGADPGPVCYGNSDVPTLTDAHVLLGHVASGAFLGGELELDHDAVARAFEELGKRLGTSARDAARSSIDVARAAMRRALRVMTLERGRDPAHLPLVAFGGAGGLHAAELAREIGARACLVPQHPGALSAWGMTRAGALAERARTALEPLANWDDERRASVFAELARDAETALREGGAAAASLQLEHELDLRYAGQAHELRLPASSSDPAEDFGRAHQRLYGYRLDDTPVELVALRVRARVVFERGEDGSGDAPRPRAAPESSLLGRRAADFGADLLDSPVYDRSRLAPGDCLEGPALIEEYSGTTVVPPGATARVTRGGHLRIDLER